MTIAQLIILRNADAGIVFYRDGDALKWEPPVTFTPEQLDCLRRHKADLIALVDAEADEVLTLLELPCARLGKHELISQTDSINFGLTNNGSVRKGGTTNTTAANATRAADRQQRLVRSE